MDKRRVILTITIILLVWFGLSYGWYMLQGPSDGQMDDQLNGSLNYQGNMEIKVRKDVSFFTPKEKGVEVSGSYDRNEIKISDDSGDPSGVYYEYKGDITNIKFSEGEEALLIYDPGYYNVKKSNNVLTLKKNLRPTKQGLKGITVTQEEIVVDNWLFNLIRKSLWTIFMIVIGIVGYLIVKEL